jgi:hypothetical protein
MHKKKKNYYSNNNYKTNKHFGFIVCESQFKSLHYYL